MPPNSKGEAMHNWPEMTKELSAQLRNLRGGAPDVMKAFAGLAQSATAAKTLDAKTKELIALGIAVAMRCDDCIAFHVKAATGHGRASREEVLETLGMTIYMGARARGDVRKSRAGGFRSVQRRKRSGDAAGMTSAGAVKRKRAKRRSGAWRYRPETAQINSRLRASM